MKGKKYLVRPMLEKQGDDGVILHLQFTQEKLDQTGRIWSFPLDLTFYSYKNDNNEWRPWATSSIKVESNSGFYRLDELASVIGLISKKIEAVNKNPQSIMDALGRSFAVVYHDERTGDTVEKIENIGCSLFKARMINPENGNFVYPGRAMAINEDEARKQIAKDLITQSQFDELNQWLASGGEVVLRNYVNVENNDTWYLTIDQMIAWPDKENAINASVQKEEANA